MVRKLIDSRKGQALVEMALVLPILILILMGIIEFGRVLNAYLIITNASREGARYAAIHNTDAQIQTTVSNLTTTLNQSDISVTISPSYAYRTSGTAVTVTVGYSVDIITPIMSAVIPNPYPLSAQTTMRVE